MTGSFSNDNGDDSESVTIKKDFAFFKHFVVINISLV